MVGEIRQDLDTFRMPVEVKVETEGNPEYKKILVSGTIRFMVIHSDVPSRTESSSINTPF